MLYNYVDMLYSMGLNVGNSIILGKNNENACIDPKLFEDVATSVYGNELCVFPSSVDAMILTSFINNYIVMVKYHDRVKYSKPIGDYIKDFGDLEVIENSDGTYKLNYKEKTKALPTNTINNVDRIYSLGINIFKEMASENNNQLLQNVAFSKYNEYLNLNPLGRDALLITAVINNNIINKFYKDQFEFEESIIEEENKTTLS